jgi:hypothetical protein
MNLQRRLVRWWGLVATTVVGAGVVVAGWSGWQSRQSLLARMANIQPLRAAQVVDCASLRSSQPLVLLALGQSNAGNHGALPLAAALPPQAGGVWVVHEGLCALVNDPLPGGTGHGGSIWQRLPARLAAGGLQRPVLMAVLAVDASTVSDWTRWPSPLRQRLAATTSNLVAQGLPPDLVLWQQGESDARLSTSTDDYVSGMQSLARLMTEAGSNAPVVLAQSTVCRSAPSVAVRQAVQALAQPGARFVMGPDTDTLVSDTYRSDGCHFSANGLDAAALLWQAAVEKALAR